MPTVRSIDPDTPNRVELPLMVPYDVVQLTAIQESFPELRKQLASKWPVKGIWRVLKNALPAHYLPNKAFVFVRHGLKKAVWKAIPLEFRKRVAIWLDRQRWLSCCHDWSMLLIRDLAEANVEAYHRFLWSHHLGYAGLCEARHGFGAENLSGSSRQFFADLTACLLNEGIHFEEDVKSVFEVGCAQGYLLRYAEADLFPSATDIVGIDIDEVALQQGKAYLKEHGSKVRLQRADMAELDSVLADKTYDVILCPGVLSYLTEEQAEKTVEMMLRHARYLLAIITLGHPEVDNVSLPSSQSRQWDASLYHNVDAMVEKAGGQIVFRRWQGKQPINGQRVHVVFAKSCGTGLPWKKEEAPQKTRRVDSAVCQVAKSG